VQWAYPGGVSLDKYDFLDILTKKLLARGCAVGWNPEWQGWDLETRRGVLGKTRIRMVVEHHGGPKRLARLSAVTKPSKLIYWILGFLLSSIIAMGALGLYIPILVLGIFMAILWIAPIIEANRLEAAMEFATEDIVMEMGAYERG
jgi:hypothetical protein